MRLLFTCFMAMLLIGLTVGCDDDDTIDASTIGDTNFYGIIDSITPDSAYQGDSLIVRVIGIGTSFGQGDSTGAYLKKDTTLIFGQGYDTLSKTSTRMDSRFIILETIDTGLYDFIIYDKRAEINQGGTTIKIIDRIKCEDCFRIMPKTAK